MHEEPERTGSVLYSLPLSNAADRFGHPSRTWAPSRRSRSTPIAPGRHSRDLSKALRAHRPTGHDPLRLQPRKRTIPLLRGNPRSTDLGNVVSFARRLTVETEGAFDITAGAVTHLWRRARKQKRLPTTEEIAHALQRRGTICDAGGSQKDMPRTRPSRSCEPWESRPRWWR